MINYYQELDDRQVDVLGEIGNIGAGAAATSLSVLVDEYVSVSVPRVRILDYDSIIRMTGGPEDPGVAIMIRVDGDVQGLIMFLLSYEDAYGIAEMLTGSTGGRDDPGGMSDMKLSALKEIGNILGSSYLGSISTLTGLKFGVSIPYLSIDTIGAIMDAAMEEYSINDGRTFFIEESISTEKLSFKSYIILFMDIPSVNKVISMLGIEV